MSSFHSWLAVALPAGADTIRVVGNAELAELLRDAGADVTSRRPSVEIGTFADAIVGDTATAILDLGENQPDGGGRLRRASRRASAWLSVQRQAQAACNRLRAQGYATVRVIPWDYEQPIVLPGMPSGPRRLAERLPERAVVIAHRDADSSSLLDGVVAEAAGRIGDRPHVRRLLVRAGVLVAILDRSVVRVALGPASRRIHQQGRVLSRLADAPAVIGDRLPLPIHTGETGLATWSVERRVPGAPIVGEVSGPLLEDCLAFLVALHGVGDRSPSRSIADDARRCASVCESPAVGAELRALGERLEVILADVPRGAAHGDFWVQNLLRNGDRLAGVFDWDGGGCGRLPLLDLIHLRVSGYRDGVRISLGTALLRSELDVARQGGDELTRRYCALIGLTPDPAVLEALVHAFWIERAALELELRPDMVSPTWIDDNVVAVLDQLRQDDRSTI